MDHPAKDCTKRQIEVFEQIAISQDGGHSRRTVNAQEKKGLIVGRDEILDGWRGRPVRRFHVPLPLHAQWCQWASEEGYGG